MTAHGSIEAPAGVVVANRGPLEADPHHRTESTGLPRIVRRALILGGGVAAAWIVGAALQSSTASAQSVAPTVPAVAAITQLTNTPVDPARTAVGGVIAEVPAAVAPVIATSPAATAVPAIVSPVVTPLTPVLTPVLEPVESLVNATPVGDVITVVTSPPAPIQGPPVESLLTDVLPVAPAVAEQSDVLALTQHPDSAGPATEALRPGSVPVWRLISTRSASTCCSSWAAALIPF